jgi:formylglycine-generating enzyme required for sulfatase activity
MRKIFAPRRLVIWLGVTGAVGTVVGMQWDAARKTPPSLTVQKAEQAKVPAGMVYIPGGEFWLGSNDEDADEEDKPARRVYVPSFAMDRTEVTNTEYRRFKPDHTFPAGEDNLPVTNVLYDEAAAYAKWAGKRLPTELEWEKAARGTDGRRYPWGNDWKPERVTARPRKSNNPEPILTKRPTNQCVVGNSRVRSVGSKPDGASPYGCLDMAGNAWEWVQGFYHGDPERRLLRGGAVGYGERACRTYGRAIEGAGVT